MTLPAAIVVSAHMQATIPERVRAKVADRTNEPIMVVGTHRDFTAMPLEQLARESQLVLVATLQWKRSYLTPDERHIETDFRIVPNQIISGQFPASVTATPTQTYESILTVSGGDVMLEGRTVTEPDSRREMPVNNHRYLLFLVPFGPQPARYQIQNVGIFELKDNGTLRSLLKGDHRNGYEDITDLPTNEILTQIRQAPRSR
jgi:hypothetical protein